MPTILQFRRGTTAQNDNYTGSVGELTIDVDVDTLRIHDGSTPGGHTMPSLTATQTFTNKTLTSPTLNTPTLTSANLGTPSFGTLTNCTDLPIVNGTTGTLSVARGGTGTTTSTGTGATVLSTSPTFSTQITTPAIVKSGSDGVGDIGQSDNKYANIYATVFSGTASTANYADLAEKYVADNQYDPGTVLIFGGKKEVTISLLSYETAIAGIVSTNPAYLMNNELIEEHTVSVALAGRVPCRVLGPVSKGTVLVTSDYDGVAMAIDNSKFIPGCIVGRAMEAHHEIGVIKTIEVSVGRN